MAESKLLKVKDQLNCPVCLDMYVNPKQLQCFHVYCQDCILQLVSRMGSLTCPSCRKITPMPANGVQDLPAAFHINHLLDIFNQSEESPENLKTVKEPFSSANNSLILKDSSMCQEHNGKAYIYCKTCEKLICSECTRKGRKHHKHNYIDGDIAFENMKKEVLILLDPVQVKSAALKKALDDIDTESKAISDQKVTIESQVHTAFGSLQDVLSTRKRAVTTQLQLAVEEKLQSLSDQKDEIVTTFVRIRSFLDFMDTTLKSGSLEKLLPLKPSMPSQIWELDTQFQKLSTLQPKVTADLTFTTSLHVEGACENNYGHLSMTGQPDASGCYATDTVVYSELTVGTNTTANIQFDGYRDAQGKEITIKLDCTLVSDLNGTTSKGKVERKGAGQYEVTYAPLIKGKHKLHIKLQGQHIKGSPFPVMAESQVKKLGTPLLTIPDLRGPTGILTTKEGEVIVVENTKHCYSIFSYGGEKLRSFGFQGSNPGQFNSPFRMAVDTDGNFLLANCLNHRIEKLTANGELIACVNGAGQLQILHPKDVAFNKKNQLVYIVHDNDSVKVLNSDLTHHSTFGETGNGKGQLTSPRGIACDDTGNVYVADSGNNRIQVFTAEGKFVRTFGKRGEGKGELKFPTALALDKYGNVYVSDNHNNRIVVFTANGQFLTNFGKKEFYHPQGIAVDMNGVVYACDYENNCYHVF